MLKIEQQLFRHVLHEKKVLVTTPAQDIFHITIVPLGFSLKKSYFVEEQTQSIPFHTDESKTHFYFYHDSCALSLCKETLAFQFLNQQQEILWESDTITPFTFQEDQGFHMKTKMTQHQSYYGLGQDNDIALGTLCRNHTVRKLYTGQKISKGKTTADIPIPFFICQTEGHPDGTFGFLLDNPYETSFDFGVGNPDCLEMHSTGGVLSFYLIYGKTMKNTLTCYTNLTGKPSLLPLWAYGYIQSKCTYKTWDEVDDVIYQFHKNQLPMDAIVFDFDWAEDFNNFQWNARYKQSPEKIAHYKKQGIHFVLSNSGPMIKKSSSNYADGISLGIFATDGEGHTVTCGHYGGDLIDVTAENLFSWLEKQLAPLIAQGIEGWWLDLVEPEGEPPQTHYQKAPRAEIHNVYALLTTQLFHDISKKYAPNQRPFILSRTGNASIQKYNAAIWTGDVYSDYQTFAAHCPGALSSALSGIGHWTSDTGGFISSTYDPATQTHVHLYQNDLALQGNLFLRWLQFSCFCPLTRSHHVGPSAPTDFSPTVLSGAKRYLQLRYQLLPYIYTYAYRQSTTGIPMMQPMILAYETDDRFTHVQDQYLFGDVFLVAPVFSENTFSRSVIFPEGTWIDFDYGHHYKGPQTAEVLAPLDRLPLFVKEGAIIPTTEAYENTSHPWDVLQYWIYPTKNTPTSFESFQDDGISCDSTPTFTTVTCAPQKNRMDLTLSRNNDAFVPHIYEFVVSTQTVPEQVLANGVLLENVQFLSCWDICDNGWYYDPLHFRLWIKLTRTEAQTIMIQILLGTQQFSQPPAPKIQSLKVEEVTIQESTARIPYLYPPSVIPCKILFCNYDRGGKNVAYFVYNTMPHTSYRDDEVVVLPSDDMGGGYIVGQLKKDEWLKYTIDVSMTGKYTLHLRYRAKSEFNIFFLECNDVDISTRLNVVQTDLQWDTLTIGDSFLEKGEQTLKIQIVEGMLDLNYVVFETTNL